jgi:hypothetical protein
VGTLQDSIEGVKKTSAVLGPPHLLPALMTQLHGYHLCHYNAQNGRQGVRICAGLSCVVLLPTLVPQVNYPSLCNHFLPTGKGEE